MNCSHKNIEGKYISNPNGKDYSIEICIDCGELTEVIV